MSYRLAPLFALACVALLGACATSEQPETADTVAAKARPTCVKSTGSNLCRSSDGTSGLNSVDPEAFRNRPNSTMRGPAVR